MTEEIKETRKKLIGDLHRLRPYMRSEYRAMLGDAGIPEMDEKLYREKVFDFERAPHVEKNGIEKAIDIIGAVSADVFPNTTIYLFTCLQRTEAFHYELLRPENEPGKDESRSLMFKLGLRKTIRKTAAMLPESALNIWRCRRQLLDVLENELWRIELDIGETAEAEKVTKLRMLADTLHAITPAQLSIFESDSDLKESFVRENGEPAKKLLLFVADKNISHAAD